MTTEPGRILTTHVGVLQRPPAAVAANVCHEHEYHLWESVRLPEGTRRAPGVVTRWTNLIEQPELGWAKLATQAEGARLATGRLWGS